MIRSPTSRTSLLLPRRSTVALLPGFFMPVTFTTFPLPTYTHSTSSSALTTYIFFSTKQQ